MIAKKEISIDGERFGSVFGKERTIEKTQNYNYDHLFDKYDGDTTNLVKIVAKDDLVNAGWNKNYFCRITNENQIYIHPNQKEIPGGERFVRIIFGEQKFIVSVLKAYLVYKDPESDYNFGLEENIDIFTEKEIENDY